MTISLKTPKSKRKTNSLRFATGLFAFTLLGQLYHGFNLAYFVDSGLIDIFLSTVCKVLFIITDSVNDLFFGMLSEKTKTRWGKRLPWLVGGVPFFIFFVVFCYFPDASFNWSSGGFFMYYLIFSLMIENCSTVLYTNYNALFPVLFVTDDERSKTSTFKHVLELIAMGICYVCTPALREALGGSLFKVGLIYGAIFLVVMVFCISGIRQPKVDKEEEKKEKKYRFVDTVKDVLANKTFVLYHMTQSFFTAILGLIVSLYPMYCQYVLKANGFQQSLLMGCFFGALLLSLPLWFLIVRKRGFRFTYKLSYSLLPIGLLLLAFPTNWWQGIIILTLVGPCAGGLMITPDLMATELIDIDKMKHGISREASFASMGSLISRVSLIISAIAMALFSFAFGYRNGNDPGPNPDLAFRFLMGIFLAIIAAIGVIFCYFYIKRSRADSNALVKYKAQKGLESTDKLEETIYESKVEDTPIQEEPKTTTTKTTKKSRKSDSSKTKEDKEEGED